MNDPIPAPGAFAYVVNGRSDNASVIDLATNVVTSTIDFDSPFGIAIRPDGVFGYVTNLGASTVSVIDLVTNTVTSTVSVIVGAFGIAIRPDGAFAYVTGGLSVTCR